eukprot:3124193-Rhodomonas_salina.2
MGHIINLKFEFAKPVQVPHHCTLRTLGLWTRDLDSEPLISAGRSQARARGRASEGRTVQVEAAGAEAENDDSERKPGTPYQTPETAFLPVWNKLS